MHLTKYAGGLCFVVLVFILFCFCLSKDWFYPYLSGSFHWCSILLLPRCQWSYSDENEWQDHTSSHNRNKTKPTNPYFIRLNDLIFMEIGTSFLYKGGLSRYGISITKIRRPLDPLIFIMGNPVLYDVFILRHPTPPPPKGPRHADIKNNIQSWQKFELLPVDKQFIVHRFCNIRVYAKSIASFTSDYPQYWPRTKMLI